MNLNTLMVQIALNKLNLIFFLPIVILHHPIRNDRRQNNPRNDIKRHAHAFTVANDQVREENAVNRFEIGREHDRVRRQSLHDVDRRRKRIRRANRRKQDQVEPVVHRQLEKSGRKTAVVQQVKRHEKETRQKLIQTDHGRVVLLDQFTVEDCKHHAHKNRKQRTDHAFQIFDLDVHDQAQASDDDEPEQDFVPQHLAFVKNGLEYRREKGARRKHCERHRNVRDIDRAEEENPMDRNQQPDQNEIAQRTQRQTERFFGKDDVSGQEQRGQSHAVPNQ